MSSQLEERNAKLDFYEEGSMVRSSASLGSLLTFNIHHGYLEALLRGFRSGFVSGLQYRQLCQCETLDDAKLSLGDTDYASALQGIAGGRLTPDMLVDRCAAKLVDEFDHVRAQATGAFATFMDFIAYEYMLNNISFLILGLIKGGAPENLLAKCDPLGKFPRMNSILTFENGEDGLLDLYSSVLVDTPVAPYFEAYFEAVAPVGSAEPFEHMHRVFSEDDVDIANDVLKRLWLDDFYRYTQTLGGETSSVMAELLAFEADRRAISIMINSFGTPLNDPYRRDERSSLFASFGLLYPEGIERFSSVSDMAQLGAVLEDYRPYHRLWQRAQNEGKELEDVLYEREVELNRLAFEGQSHLACIWAFVKLKEQEKRNLFWITECINQKQKDPAKINRWIEIF